MNWETYKQMTPEQQKEYDFRFGKREPLFNIVGIFSWVTIFLMMVNFLLYSSYLFMIGEHFVELKDKVGDLLVAAMQVIKVIIPVVIFAIIWDGLGNLIFIIRKNIWLRKNGIKPVYTYKKWLKWLKNKKAENGDLNGRQV